MILVFGAFWHYDHLAVVAGESFVSRSVVINCRSLLYSQLLLLIRCQYMYHLASLNLVIILLLLLFFFLGRIAWNLLIIVYCWGVFLNYSSHVVCFQLQQVLIAVVVGVELHRWGRAWQLVIVTRSSFLTSILESWNCSLVSLSLWLRLGLRLELGSIALAIAHTTGRCLSFEVLGTVYLFELL